MKATYHYVVLRLAPEPMRGEIINVGIVLFHAEAPARAIFMATLNKLRAIDAGWDTARLQSWLQNVESILERREGIQAQVRALSLFGLCEEDAVGMFTAATQDELQEQVRAIRATYVANHAGVQQVPREKRTRLQTALRKQFERMQIMGRDAGDIDSHLVVANVPVPTCPELKTDFVYRNGVYRVTQTLDYNVAPDSLHNKLAEACVKSTAAEMALKAYGNNTLRLAVVDIPDTLRDAADAHIDLLLHQGFEVFHYTSARDMDIYLQQAAPGVQNT